MRPDVDFLKARFNQFNTLCFDSLLPDVTIRMSNAARSVGMFIHPRGYPAGKPRDAAMCHIRISCRLDLPEREIEDIIIHEMIHYWIWFNAISDNGPHGNVFRTKMNEINSRYSRNISIRHKSTEEQLASDHHHRNNYICVQRWQNGDLTLTVCARTCIFNIHRAFAGDPRVQEVRWFWSQNPWFNRFPLSRTPKAYALASSEFDTHFANATPCECDGRILRPNSGRRHNR